MPSWRSQLVVLYLGTLVAGDTEQLPDTSHVTDISPLPCGPFSLVECFGSCDVVASHNTLLVAALELVMTSALGTAADSHTALTAAASVGVAAASQDRAFNDRRYYIGSSKLESLGWKERTTWDKGLRKTIDWWVCCIMHVNLCLVLGLLFTSLVSLNRHTVGDLARTCTAVWIGVCSDVSCIKYCPACVCLG